MVQQTFIARIVVDTKDKTTRLSEDELRNSIFTIVNHEYLDIEFPDQELHVNVMEK